MAPNRSCTWTQHRAKAQTMSAKYFKPLAVRWHLLGVLVMASLLSACMPRQLLVNSAADALTAQGQVDEEDLGLAREASAFYLKVSESLLRP